MYPPPQKDGIQTLDIDSTYRDRTKFPNPNSFDIPMYFGKTPSTAKTSKDPVALSFPIVTDTSFGSYAGPSTTIILNSNSMPYNTVYGNYYIENDCNSFAGTHEYYKILSYEPATFEITVPTAFTPTNNYNIRKELPLVRDTLSSGISNKAVVLGGLASSVDKFYENSYLRIFTGVASQSYSLIIGYTGSTKTAILDTPFPSIPGAGNGYEILPYTRDNFNPLIYHGTALNQTVNYDFELMYLILPNVFVSNGNAGLLDDYPYFYVKIYNINSKPSSTRMITNNPNSNDAIFRVPVDVTLKNDTFFTLKTKNPAQTISFKPDDSLHFSVCLPTGEPIEFLNKDWFSPAPPNALLQISATFSIKRNV